MSASQQKSEKTAQEPQETPETTEPEEAADALVGSHAGHHEAETDYGKIVISYDYDGNYDQYTVRFSGELLRTTTQDGLVALADALRGMAQR